MQSLTIIQELVARFKAKSPKLFRVISYISLVCMFITGIPELLQYFGLAIPTALAPFASKTIALATSLSFLISQLTVETPDTEKVLLGTKKPTLEVTQ